MHEHGVREMAIGVPIVYYVVCHHDLQSTRQHSRTSPARRSIIQIASVHLLESERTNKRTKNVKFKERTNTYVPMQQRQSVSRFARAKNVMFYL